LAFIVEVIVALQYPMTYFTLAVASSGVGWLAFDQAFWPLVIVSVWAGLSFLIIALLYALNWCGPLGKRANGGRWFWAWPLFGPYFVLSEISYLIARKSGRVEPHAEIAPGLYLGRRLAAVEAEEAVRKLGIRGVVDLACEFSEVPIFRMAEYLSVPVLDAMPPREDQLREAIAWINRVRKGGPVYLHCALGHGRSATVAVAYLVKTGLANDVTDAIRRIKTGRAGIKLHPAQRAVAESIRRGTA
jgi:hypothetical protein